MSYGFLAESQPYPDGKGTKVRSLSMPVETPGEPAETAHEKLMRRIRKSLPDLREEHSPDEPRWAW